MTLKHRGKEFGCLAISVSSFFFLAAIKMLIATTQKKKSMLVFSKKKNPKNTAWINAQTNTGNWQFSYYDKYVTYQQQKEKSNKTPYCLIDVQSERALLTSGNLQDTRITRFSTHIKQFQTLLLRID